jgi:hypothetical protein
VETQLFQNKTFNQQHAQNMKFSRPVIKIRTQKKIPLEEARLQALAYLWRYICDNTSMDNISILGHHPLRNCLYFPTQVHSLMRLHGANGGYKHIQAGNSLGAMEDLHIVGVPVVWMQGRQYEWFRLQLSRAMRARAKVVLDFMNTSAVALRREVRIRWNISFSRLPVYVFFEDFEIQVQHDPRFCHCNIRFGAYLIQSNDAKEGDEYFT